MKTALTSLGMIWIAGVTLFAAEFPRVTKVELQPLKAQVRRVVEAVRAR